VKICDKSRWDAIRAKYSVEDDELALHRAFIQWKFNEKRNKWPDEHDQWQGGTPTLQV